MLSELVKTEYGFDIGIEAGAMIVLLILGAAIIREGLIDSVYSKYLLGLTVFQLAMLICDCSTYFLYGTAEGTGALKVATTGSFIFMLLSLFWFNCFLISFLRERTFVLEEILYVMAFLCGVAIIVFIVGMMQPDPWFFDITESGEFERMNSYYVLILIPLLLMVFDLMLIISCRKSLSGTEIFTWMSFEIFPVLALGLYFIGVQESAVFTSGTFAVLLLYANLHVVRTKELADDRLELSESKVKLLISQMQPHFMYNSLNSIYYLIGKDPDTAKEALNTFSGYLRDNINSLRSSKTIPVSEELRHIDAYLKMEKLRFGDDLNFEFDIQADDFYIPALSIQPLVENAVKHGVSQREEGGTVKLSTYSDEENYYVKIEDDGVGFDARSYKDNEASSHIGIFNVNSRIKIMCHGRLHVTSEIDKGTVALVTLPKDGQKEYRKSENIE